MTEGRADGWTEGRKTKIYVSLLYFEKAGDNNLHKEKLNVKFCKYLLGVNKNASNLAIREKLGRYPLYIDVVVSMIK